MLRLVRKQISSAPLALLITMTFANAVQLVPIAMAQEAPTENPVVAPGFLLPIDSSNALEPRAPLANLAETPEATLIELEKLHCQMGESLGVLAGSAWFRFIEAGDAKGGLNRLDFAEDFQNARSAYQLFYPPVAIADPSGLEQQEFELVTALILTPQMNLRADNFLRKESFPVIEVKKPRPNAPLSLGVRESIFGYVEVPRAFFDERRKALNSDRKSLEVRTAGPLVEIIERTQLRMASLRKRWIFDRSKSGVAVYLESDLTGYVIENRFQPFGEHWLPQASFRREFADRDKRILKGQRELIFTRWDTIKEDADKLFDIHSLPVSTETRVHDSRSGKRRVTTVDEFKSE